MRKTTLVGLGLLLSGCMNPVPSQQVAPEDARVTTPSAEHGAQEKTFAGIPWGADMQTLTSMLEDQGFTFVETDVDGDHVLNGTLMGFPARVFAFMAEDRVVKFQVIIITPDEDAIDTFREMKDVLASQYGAPSEEQEAYGDPYRKGDGREAEAIKAGKGMLALSFDGGPWMEVTSQLVVSVNYESAAWPAEHEKRKLAEARQIF